MSDKFKITEEEVNEALMHSPFVLPDSPSHSGLGAGQIKKYFYDFIRQLSKRINGHLSDVGDDVQALADDDITNLALAKEYADEQIKVLATKDELKGYYKLRDLESYSNDLNNLYGPDSAGVYMLNGNAIENGTVKNAPSTSWNCILTVESANHSNGTDYGTIQTVKTIDKNHTQCEWHRTGYKSSETGEVLWGDWESYATDTELSAYAKKEALTSFASKEELEDVAKEVNRAISFDSYQKMQETLKGYERDALNVGQNIYIKTIEVPDLWVYAIASNYSDYTRTDDEILNVFAKGNQIQVGYFGLAPLETQKVNLEGYYKLRDLESYSEDLNDLYGADSAGVYMLNGNAIDSGTIGNAPSTSWNCILTVESANHSNGTDYGTIQTVKTIDKAHTQCEWHRTGYKSSEAGEVLWGDWESYATDKELENALSRVSGGTAPTQKTWEKIVDYTVADGDTSPFSFAFDGFSLAEFQGKIVYQNGGAGASVNFDISIRTGTNQNNRTLARTTINNFSSDKRTWHFRYLSFGENQGGLFVSPDSFGSHAGSYPNINIGDNKVFYLPAKTSDNENIYYYNSFSAIVINPSVALSAGDTIEIWGVKK